ncbi:exported hypothetical protein [uncultured Pleomorphomonas sp.]|uniref:Peptidase S9 prolyl oligopeptidase catalytic domain-containing protein n=2 Tax=uncultured Pleomorphomonas sp. TaxID=442121 RepID=A0A212LFE6_9HYPH|nr:exported hypothetical protein [uncultured Pleomorphomonas sp.]
MLTRRRKLRAVSMIALSAIIGVPAAAMANPETWLTPDCPPVLFQHAPADPIVPVQMSVHFAARINEVAGPGRARLHFVEGTGHAGPEFDRPEVVGRTIVFLKEVLRVI